MRYILIIIRFFFFSFFDSDYNVPDKTGIEWSGARISRKRLVVEILRFRYYFRARCGQKKNEYFHTRQILKI